MWQGQQAARRKDEKRQNLEQLGMVCEWRTRSLGELTENYDSIRVPVKETDRRSGPYPYYGASGIVDYVDGYLFDGEYLLIAEDGENLRTRTTPIAFLARGKFWVNNHAHVVKGNGEADTRFLMYALAARDISGYLTGSTIPKLSQRALNQITLLTPPIDEQRAIAHILGTLDDKIELNRRMNATLEAIARAIFKSWFVDFDPVHAKARGEQPYGMDADTAALFPDAFEDSELGPIPAGWGVGTLGDHVINLDSKRIPMSSAERANRKGPYPYYGAASIIDYVDDFLFDGIYLLVGEDGSVVRETGLGVTQYVWGQIWVNNHAHVLQGKGSVSTEQLLLYFDFQPVAPYVTGAVQPKLSQGRMNQMPFVYAGDDVCRAFYQTVSPYFALLRATTEQNRSLAELRDTLLPKLISGEIRVSEAEALSGDRML